MTRLLLLSGGIDSTCLAAWSRPDQCLSVDYGQRAGEAERQAAAAVAHRLHLPITHVEVDASAVGSGLMANIETEFSGPSAQSSAPEWWPFRNQLLITLAAAWGINRGATEVLVGTVAGDSSRHTDGSVAFYHAIGALLRLQEGGLTVAAPAMHLSTEQLLVRSQVDDATLASTHSCHLGNVACGHCPGCLKRGDALAATGRLR